MINFSLAKIILGLETIFMYDLS